MLFPLNRLYLLLLLLGPFVCLATDFPERPIPHQYIHNLSSELVISPEDAASLEKVYRALSMEAEVAFVGVIVDSLSGVEPRYFANELANRWKIGEEWEDRALLLLCSLKDRKLFLATGKGVQDLITDDKASQLLVQYLVPRFKEENYVGGLFDLANPIQRELTQPTTLNSDLGLLVSIITGLVFLLLQILEYLNVLPISKVDPRIAKGKYISLGIIFLALVPVFIYRTYFTLWPALIGAFLLALLVNSWTLRGLVVLWDQLRRFPRYSEEELNLGRAHAYLVYILLRSGKAGRERLAEKVFLELLFARALDVKFDEKKYSPVKGKNVGSDTYIIHKGDTYEERKSADVAFQSFYKTIFPSTVSALMRFAITPEAYFAIGERLVGSDLISYGSWKKGEWKLTEKGETLRREAEEVRAGIEQVLENERLSVTEVIDELEEVRHILFALPRFADRIAPLLMEKSGPKKKTKMPAEIEGDESWWFWTYMDYAQDVNALLWELPENLYPSGRGTYFSSKSSTSRSYTSSSDYHDSTSYSDGSFDGGGGGAEW